MSPPPGAELLVVDSHTAGEPTRVVVQGAPLPENANPIEVRAALRAEADWVRTALTYEPRGAAWMVGAVLTPATQPDCVAGVVFFNNAGYLGMCGHGLIGVVTTLHDRGAIDYGVVRIETPAGVIKATLRPDRSVCFENVVSYRLHKSVELQVPGYGLIRGDVAYGGNWFFLARVDQVDPARLAKLTDQAIQIKRSLIVHGITGEHGAEIDHVELFGPPSPGGGADSKNFVLCPGGQYDRSPCGTGTSAKVACLAADGALHPGDIWTQESILGGLFQSSYREVDGGVIPTICGRAYVTGETRVRFDPDDPHTAGF